MTHCAEWGVTTKTKAKPFNDFHNQNFLSWSFFKQIKHFFFFWKCHFTSLIYRMYVEKLNDTTNNTTKNMKWISFCMRWDIRYITTGIKIFKYFSDSSMPLRIMLRKAKYMYAKKKRTTNERRQPTDQLRHHSNELYIKLVWFIGCYAKIKKPWKHHTQTTPEKPKRTKWNCLQTEKLVLRLWSTLCFQLRVNNHIKNNLL